jgi:hypothetical protein
MKNVLKYLACFALISPTFGTAHAATVSEDACFVISGTHFDYDNAFSSLTQAERSHTKFKFGHYRCSIFNSYPELDAYLSRSYLPEGSPILVIQAAHGGAGGTGEFNGGLIEADQELVAYRKLANHFSVAIMNQSCFSGTLLQEKLEWDDAHPQSKSIDNLCLWADSLPNRESYSSVYSESFKRPYTFEDAYLASPKGILSSAAWSESEMTGYTTARRPMPIWMLKRANAKKLLTPLAETFMTQMVRILKEGAANLTGENEKIYENADLALSTSMDDASLSAYITAHKSESPAPTASQSLTPDGSFYSPDVRNAVFNPLTASMASDACAQAVHQYIISLWYPVFRSSQHIWTDFVKSFDAASANGNTGMSTACQNFSSPKSGVEWVSYLSHYTSVTNFMGDYVSTHAADGVSNTQVAAQAVNPEPYVSAANGSFLSRKRETFDSIIGNEVWNAEASYANVPIYGNVRTAIAGLNVPGATGNVLPAFVLASLVRQDMPNALDQRRRNACRNITLLPEHP